jgi:hypothetical protein
MAEYKENCIYIKDSLLEPYYIKVKLNTYELYKTNPGKLDEFCGCISNFQEILKKIARLLIHKEEQETISLKEYINRYEKIIEKLIKYIPEIK